SLIDESEQKRRIVIYESSARTYTTGKAAGHLTGFEGTSTEEELEEQEDVDYEDGDIIGKRGLEQLYEDKLRGKDGAKISITSDEETEEENVLAEKEPKDGENVHLTIDEIGRASCRERVKIEEGARTG